MKREEGRGKREEGRIGTDGVVLRRRTICLKTQDSKLKL
jgi:hypothetical protein